MKYSARAHPLYGAIYCMGTGSSAVEHTTQVYPMAPPERSTLTVFASDDAFCPMET